MADTTRNIFSLSEYSDDTIAGDGIPVDSVYVLDAYPNTGYFAGGTGGDTSVTKAVFDTDTLSNFTGMPWPGNTNNGSAMVSGTHMYMAFGSTNSKVSRIEYATDNIATLPSGTPSPQMWQTSKGVYGTNTVGYVAGGQQLPGFTDRSIMYKMSYASETWNDLSGSNAMPSAYSRRVATSSATKGYMSGGNPTNPWTFSMDYATETDRSEFNAPGNDTSSAKGASGTSSETHGYFTGGDYNYTWSLNFSSNTILRLPASNYPLSEVNGQGTAGSITDGYHGGGSGGPSGVRSSIYKFNYSTGSWSNISAMPGNRSNPYGGGARTMPASLTFPKKRWKDDASITPNDGYVGTGGSPHVSNVDRVNMTTDSVQRVPGMNAYNDSWLSGANMASSPSRGYYNATYPGGRSSVWQIIYATDSRAHEPSNNTSIPFEFSVSTGHSTKGYIMGGRGSSPSPTTDVSMVHRMTYSNDTTARVPGANLQPGSNEYGTGEGNSAVSSSGDESGAAYLTGGKGYPSQSMKSTVWKMSYSTETTAVIPAKLNRYAMGGFSEKSAGYFAGGYPGPYPGVVKFPWATETFTEDGGDNMRRSAASFGNQQAGYQAGGTLPSGPNRSDISKFTFSTSTSEGLNTSILSGTPSTAPRQNAWGTGALTSNLPSVPDAPTATPTPSVSKENQNYALFHASNDTDYKKRDFSTDTTSSLTNNYAPAGWHSDAVADENAIYTNNYADPNSSTKITWSTQTTTVTPGTWSGGVNPYWTGQSSATNMDQTKGYFTGGNYPSISPTPSDGVGRRRQHIVFATGTGVNDGDAAQDYITRSAGGDSATRGYMFGGQTAPGQASGTVSYMNFASGDSWNTVPGNPSFSMSYRRIETAVVGNKDKLYIAGALYPAPNMPAPASRFERFTFSTETRNLLPSVVLSSNSNRKLTATGNQTQGYWSGSGYTGISNKLVYSTETVSNTTNYPSYSGADNWAMSQAQNAQPGQINVPVSIL